MQFSSDTQYLEQRCNLPCGDCYFLYVWKFHRIIIAVQKGNLSEMQITSTTLHALMQLKTDEKRAFLGNEVREKRERERLRMPFSRPPLVLQKPSFTSPSLSPPHFPPPLPPSTICLRHLIKPNERCISLRSPSPSPTPPTHTKKNLSNLRGK